MQPDPAPSRPADLKRLGRYKIVRPLSKGGMALVYEARRESLAGVSPRVAIKLILPEHEASDTFRELFINEARLGASMHHQNLVQIQDFDCDSDRYFLVMEYVEGITLRRNISTATRHGIQLPLGVIAEIGRQACDGLHYAHCAKDDRGRHLRLVHRDMKPSNLILSPHGVVKVLDFGISKGRLRQERQGSVKGTWGYMAPEQAIGQPIWPNADVFGLAIVLAELASLRPLFMDKGKDEIKRLLADDHAARMAATLDATYSPLVPVLVRALQRDPKARFQSAESFGRALSSLLPDPITARDEVTRFYELVHATDAGKPVPGRPPSAASQGSIMSVARSEAGSATTVATPVVFTTLAAAGVAAASMVAMAAGVAFLVTREDSPTVPGTEPATLQDIVAEEPAGPAGEGAPGEQRTAEPRPSRRPPRSRVGRSPSPPPLAPAPHPEPDEPVVIRINRQHPPPPPVVVHEEPVAAPPALVRTQPTEAVRPGVLIIGARQEAEVYIQGQFAGMSPVKRELEPGTYAVSVVSRDGRRASQEVVIESDQRVKRTWDFDRNQWR